MSEHKIQEATAPQSPVEQAREFLKPTPGVSSSLHITSHHALRMIAEFDALREAFEEYAEHMSWRCAYRSRYDKCCCGLDDLTDRLGLPRVAVHDPEAPDTGGSAASKKDQRGGSCF